jgi:hypothetical protein
VLGHDAMPVKHGWNFAGGAQRLRAGRTKLGAPLDGEVQFFASHGFLYKRRG